MDASSAEADLLPQRLVVVDTDAGADDAMALLALFGAEAEAKASGVKCGARVHAVTCVNGNTGVQNVTRNVLATLRAVGRLDVPVYRGASQSLVFTPRTDAYFGADGFGDFLPQKLGFGEVQSEHAALALVRMAAEQPGRITLVCLGPMTNVALASRLDPAFLDNLAEIFILGGSARGVGNTKASTEFNVYIDAEAFQAVLDSVPKPAYLLPWESVLALNMTEAWREDVLGRLPSPQVHLLNQAERVTMGKKGGQYTPADALLALCVLQPGALRSRTSTNVQVVLGDGSARGATLVDYRGKSGKPNNAVLLEQPDKELVQCLLLKLLSAPVQPASTAAADKAAQ